MKDIGFFGTKNGFTITVGGRGGRAPLMGKVLAENVPVEKAIDITARIINFHRQNGKDHERLCAFIDRIGFEAFSKEIL
jgi:dissimilatory sulfite reductase (desulfoviridin) alpha/beta subunit